MGATLTGRRPPYRLPHDVAFIVFVVSSVIAFAAAAAPTPLYDRMQQDWGYSSAMLTAAFSIYTLTLLLALLTVGSLSSYVGRRPVMVIGFSGIASSMLILCFADSIGAVLVARGAQGAATGAVISAVGSGIVGLAQTRRSSLGPTVAALAPQLGSAFGAVAAATALGLPVAPGPVVFAAFAILLFGLAVVSAWLPDAQMRATGAWKSLLPTVSVPRCARPEFVRAVPLVVSGWMLGALYLSLVPVIVREAVGEPNAVMGGLATGLFCLVAAGAGAFGGSLRPHTTAVWGAVLMCAGALTVAASVLVAQFPLFAVATVLAASGFGAGNAAAFRLVLSRAPEHQRVELLSAIYTLSYVAFGLPVVLAGGLADAFGLATASVGYAAAIAMLAFAGGTAQLLALLGRRATVSQQHDKVPHSS